MPFDGRQEGQMPSLDKIERLRAELGGVYNRLQQAHEERDAARADLAAAQTELAEAHLVLDKLGAVRDTEDDEPHRAAERIDKLYDIYNELAQARADLAAADAQIKSLDEENATINAELLKARAELAAARELLKEAIGIIALDESEKANSLFARIESFLTR